MHRFEKEVAIMSRKERFEGTSPILMPDTAEDLFLMENELDIDL